MYRENKNMNQDAHQTILRGDLYYADLSPVVGSEQGGIRPVLVIQNDVGNKYSPTVIVAGFHRTGRTDSHHRPEPFEGIHRTSGFRSDGGN